VTHHRSFIAVTVLAATLGLSGCAGSGSTATSSTAAKTAAGSAAAASPSTASPSTQPSAGSAHASGNCSSIDKAAAESILGSPTAAGLSSKTNGLAVGGMKKVDGCTYRSASDGSLGYTVLRGDANFGHTMIGAVQSRMTTASKKPGSPVKVFDAGLPDSVAFTQHFGGGVDSQITVLSGDSLITVAVARKDGNVAKAQASAKAAAQRLISAV
jgi:hypothetical protein